LRASKARAPARSNRNCASCGPARFFRRGAVGERSELSDLRLVGFFAVEDGGDIRNRARRGDERGANFDWNVPSGVGLGRCGRGNACGLLLFFADNARAHNRGAASLFRFFQFGAGDRTRIADLAAYAGTQLLHMRLLARFDDLLVAGGECRL